MTDLDLLISTLMRNWMMMQRNLFQSYVHDNAAAGDGDYRVVIKPFLMLEFPLRHRH